MLISNVKALRSSSIVCLAGKQPKLDFNSSLYERERERERERESVVRYDICGPIKVPNYGGNRCFIAFFDEF